MTPSRAAFVKGASWTTATYAISQVLRVFTNFALTRILAPELFGIMIVVNTVRTGIDLVSDIGIETNVVHNKDASKPNFYNTAWSLQVLRGFLLCVVCLAASSPLANAFKLPELVLLLPLGGLYLSIGGFLSMGRFLIQKDLQFSKLNIFEMIVETFSAVVHILLALLSPTIWALVFGGLFAAAGRVTGSYFLLPKVRHHFYISPTYAKEIFSFGKWIFVSSMIYFLSTSFDRLYLGKVAPLALLGIYGIARSLSEPFGALILRIGSYVVFPTVASSMHLPRNEVREQLASIRFMFLLFVAIGLSSFAATADFVVRILYDDRYQAAGWMLPILLIGTWFSILSSLNESILLGLGKPTYGAVSNSLKFGYLLIALPLGYTAHGMLGAVVAAAAGDLCRYVPVLIGQLRERFSFATQDLFLTAGLIILVMALQWLRWKFGLGTSFDEL
jgi:O-antigen/teichoic acid export membrane protein